MTDAIMERTWTNVGAEFRQGDDKARIERAVAALEWESAEGQKAMMPALGIRECIRQLGLPKVSQIAISGADLTYPDPSGGQAYYALYGIEANYANGRARVYVLDTGGDITPVASDFWPREAAVA